MYTSDLLGVTPAGCVVDEDGCCEDWSHDHPSDARGDYKTLFDGAFLPHSCEEWVIGGPEEIRLLIRDLENALVRLGGNSV
jgi:hypothetical protein